MIAAAYIRKSSEDDRAEDAKSVTRQLDRCREYATAHGWQFDDRFVFTDDGISGGEFVKRPGYQALMAAVAQDPLPFQVLVLSERSRLGRDTIRTLAAIQTITDAGVRIFSYLDNDEVKLDTDLDEVNEFIRGWASSAERKKASQRVGDALRRRAEKGLVAGGRVFGYTNLRENDTVKRVVNEAESAVVRRIFESTADGLGLLRIAKRLNEERIPGPRGVKWSPSGVREILKRELYVGKVVYGRVQKLKRGGTTIRVRVDPSRWTTVGAPELRIVTDELWTSAHARVAETNQSYLRSSGRLQGKPEWLKDGKFLLSGIARCGVLRPDGSGRQCGEPLNVVERAVKGGQRVRTYVCRAHRAKGSTACTNRTGVPVDLLHAGVVRSLRETFSPEAFAAYLTTAANDPDARELRAAERQRLVDEIARLAKEGEALAIAISRSGDDLDRMDSLLARLKIVDPERKAAEERLATLEAEERMLRADGEAVERLRANLRDWNGALEQASPEVARQLLKRAGIVDLAVTPDGKKGARIWRFAGVAKGDGVLAGVLGYDSVVTTRSSFGRAE